MRQMMKTQEDKVFNFLTEEYSILLSITEENQRAVDEIRGEAFSKRLGASEDELKPFLREDDEQSFVYLLRHNKSQRDVGTVRVIFVNDKTPSQKIPMEKHGGVEGINFREDHLPICEVSRLSLVKDLPEHEGMDERYLRTYLSLALMSATRVNFFLHHYSKIFAFIEKPLQRILNRQGVSFKPIGEAVDHYGKRIPVMLDKKNFLLAAEKTEGTMGKLTKFYLKKISDDPRRFLSFIDKNPYLERSDTQVSRLNKIFNLHGNDATMAQLLGEVGKVESVTPEAGVIEKDVIKENRTRL